MNTHSYRLIVPVIFLLSACTPEHPSPHADAGGTGPLLASAPAAAQWPPETLVNLQVLPENTEVRGLISMMAGFTQELGVRCTYCHVGEEGQPLSTYNFPSDEKVEKRKARVMIEMVRAINGAHLAGLPERVDPPIEVTCATCHRGVPQPRPLPEVLVMTYDADGIDSTLAAYWRLRELYFGRDSYDFGDLSLSNVADAVQARGALADAVTLHALNVETHPDSPFARRELAAAALLHAFTTGGEAEGVARFRELRQAHGEEAFSPSVMGQVGQALAAASRRAEVVALHRLTVELYPELAAAHAALGGAYAEVGDTERAITAYQRALELDPNHAASAVALERLREGGS